MALVLGLFCLVSEKTHVIIQDDTDVITVVLV